MHITLDRCEQDLSLRLDHLASRNHCGLFSFHERRQVRHSLLHDAGGLDHLRQEHLAGSEEIANHAHTGHQRPFNHCQGTAKFDTSLFSVDLDVRVYSLDHRVSEALLDSAVAPFLGLLFGRDLASSLSLQLLAKLHQSLCRVGSAVEQHVLDEELQFRLNLLVDLKHSGIDDAHVHTRRDGVKKKRGVHGFAHFVIAAKAE